MGMFDTVIVNKDLLPITQSEKLSIKGDFQTKDFDCMLGNIYIKDDGFLYVYDLNRIYNIPCSMYFYTHNMYNEWFEFYTEFDNNGKMININRVN